MSQQIVCAYGSSVQPGAKTVLTVADIVLILGARIPSWAWPFIALTNYMLHGLADECTSPPPSVPDFPSIQDYCDIGSNYGWNTTVQCGPADPGRAINRFMQWLTAQAWGIVCQCNAGPGTAACPVYDATDVWTGAPGGNTYGSVFLQVPPGATAIQILTTCTVYPGRTATIHATTWDWAQANMVHDWGGFGFTAQGQSTTISINFTTAFPWNPWLRFYLNLGTGAVANATFTYHVTFIGQCQPMGTYYVAPSPGSPPSSVQSPTLVTAPTAAQTAQWAQQTLQAVENTYQKLLRLENELAAGKVSSTGTPIPTTTTTQNYTVNPIQTNVTGAGEAAVSGILGLSVRFTSFPGWLGWRPGDPLTYFDFGWLTLGNADGWMPSIHLMHNPTLVLPIDPHVTRIGWALEPDVTATVSQLVAA